MAHVHVHVGGKRRVRPARRPVRWADRVLMSIVMGIAAYVIERAVVRGTKKANANAPDAS